MQLFLNLPLPLAMAVGCTRKTRENSSVQYIHEESVKISFVLLTIDALAIYFLPEGSGTNWVCLMNPNWAQRLARKTAVCHTE